MTLSMCLLLFQLNTQHRGKEKREGGKGVVSPWSSSLANRVARLTLPAAQRPNLPSPPFGRVRKEEREGEKRGSRQGLQLPFFFIYFAWICAAPTREWPRGLQKRKERGGGKKKARHRAITMIMILRFFPGRSAGNGSIRVTRSAGKNGGKRKGKERKKFFSSPLHRGPYASLRSRFDSVASASPAGPVITSFERREERGECLRHRRGALPRTRAATRLTDRTAKHPIRKEKRVGKGRISGHLLFDEPLSSRAIR